MSRFVVAPVTELAPGQHKVVTVGGREIGVFNVDGTYYAVRNRCPHQGGPLCEGVQTGSVSSSGPGEEYVFSPERRILRCPWHQWEFDIGTGRSWVDPERLRVRAYRVDVEHGRDLQELAAAAPDAVPGPDGRVPGPYVAETYPVSVDDEYVVVDIGGRQ